MTSLPRNYHWKHFRVHTNKHVNSLQFIFIQPYGFKYYLHVDDFQIFISRSGFSPTLDINPIAYSTSALSCLTEISNLASLKLNWSSPPSLLRPALSTGTCYLHQEASVPWHVGSSLRLLECPHSTAAGFPARNQSKRQSTAQCLSGPSFGVTATISTIPSPLPPYLFTRNKSLNTAHIQREGN